MQPAKYEPRLLQPAQSRQTSSLNGSRRYPPINTRTPTAAQPSSSVYIDDGYGNINDASNGADRFWDEPGGGGQSGAEKPTGLRHFSTKVCEKVKEKGLTNYNEVADELVSDYFQNNVMKHIDVVKQEYDMKNIRRRVYDALNVLLAMNIITKNKKDIRWIGLPASASQEIARLEEEKARRETSIKTKMDTLHQMIIQLVAYKNLVDRNRKNEYENGRQDPDSVLHLPFMIISTDKDANVECSVSSDKSEFLFSFDKRFEIHDDFEVLKKMKMACGLDTGTSTVEEIKQAKKFLPDFHQDYVDGMIAHHKQVEQEKEERKQQHALRHAQGQYYYEPPSAPQTSRYNRQLQEHLNDEDHVAAAEIAEKDDIEEKDPGPIARVPLYNFSPQKLRQTPGSSVPTTRRYFVQKTAQGTVKRELSPAVRTISRPYAPTMVGERRMAAAGGTVGAPVKYYVSQGQQVQQLQQRYRVRPQPPPSASSSPAMAQQRIVYSSTPNSQLPPGQRVVTQRVVMQGANPGGTIIRKVIRKVVVNNSMAAKQSPAQQVIQKKMLEQQDPPMTSSQAAAALIQHPQPEEYDYF